MIKKTTFEGKYVNELQIVSFILDQVPSPSHVSFSQKYTHTTCSNLTKSINFINLSFLMILCTGKQMTLFLSKTPIVSTEHSHSLTQSVSATKKAYHSIHLHTVHKLTN